MIHYGEEEPDDGDMLNPDDVVVYTVQDKAGGLGMF